MPCEQVNQGVGDGAEGNAFCNAVGKGHGDDGEVAGDGFGGIIEVNARDGGEHEEPYDNQGRCCGKGRNGHENRRKKHGKEEEHCHGDGGEAGAAAFGNAGGTFYIGGGGGNAKHGAYGGSYGISHEGALDMGQLVVFIQHVCLGGHADEGADGIENINEEESQEHHYEIEGADLGEIQLHEDGGDALRFKGSKAAGEIGQCAEGAYGRIRHVETGDFTKNTQKPGEKDAPENVAPYLLHHEDGGEKDADNGQHHRNTGGMEGSGCHGSFEGEKGNLGGRIGHDNLGAAQSDEGDEKTDACGHRFLQVNGDGVEDGFTDVGKGKDNENDTFHENRSQCHFPGIAHLLHHGEGKEGVQSHARCQGKGVIGENRHKHGAQEACQRRGGEDGSLVHACGTHDTGVDGKNIGHGHKGGNSCHDFGPYGGMTFREMENPLHETCIVFHEKTPFELKSFLPYPGRTIFTPIL